MKPAGDPRKFSGGGGGLLVMVTPQGSKLWRLAYRFGGKQKLLALGAYPAISLAAARSIRDEAKGLLASGVDPSAQAKADKEAKRAAVADTFQSIADELLRKSNAKARPMQPCQKSDG